MTMALETETRIDESMDPLENTTRNGWFDIGSWCRWRPTSINHLVEAETKMLEFVSCPLEKKYLTLTSGNKLWTVVANKGVSTRTPMVMVHGFAGGIGLWAMNYDALSEKRTVYAFDLLGFGRSSRPNFATAPEQAEETFVESIEEWRKAAKLEKMILLGHSFGGFLASSYALRYPDNVTKLVLVDPWGFPERNPNPENGRQAPWWLKGLAHILSPFNPLATVRAAGPWGLDLVKKFRADFKSRYPEINEKDENTVFEYIYHCNAASPSGETAFKRMNQYLGYAYNPMLTRIGNLRSDVPVTFIYGARSWMDISSGHEAQALLPQNHVEVFSVKGAGHHVYADRPDLFHATVNTVCEDID